MTLQGLSEDADWDGWVTKLRGKSIPGQRAWVRTRPCCWPHNHAAYSVIGTLRCCSVKAELCDWCCFVCLSVCLSVSRITHELVYGCQPNMVLIRIRTWIYDNFSTSLDITRCGLTRYIFTRQRAPPRLSATSQRSLRSLSTFSWDCFEMYVGSHMSQQQRSTVTHSIAFHGFVRRRRCAKRFAKYPFAFFCISRNTNARICQWKRYRLRKKMTKNYETDQ